jgi:hypothetical protein
MIYKKIHPFPLQNAVFAVFSSLFSSNRITCKPSSVYENPLHGVWESTILCRGGGHEKERE